MSDILPAAAPTTKPTPWEIVLRSLHVLLALGALLIGVAAYFLGILFNVLLVFLLLIAGLTVISRIVGLIAKSLEFEFIRRPFARTTRPYLLQCLNRWMFAVLAGIALQLAVIPVQFPWEEYRSILYVIAGSVAVLLVLAIFPQKTVRVSTNAFFAIGWVFLAIELIRIALPPSTAEAVTLAPPFRGEWYIFQGGRSVLINHHYGLRAQRHALDIIRTEGGREFQGDKSELKSYPGYGQTLYAPAAGTVVEAVNDRPDNAIGSTDHEQIIGNHVVLEIGPARFILLAHLKKGSVRVEKGAKVTVGQPLAECGNSGNTSMPHLHIQVQDQADFHIAGMRTFPILFRNVERVRTGHREKLAAADVRRNDVIVGE